MPASFIVKSPMSPDTITDAPIMRYIVVQLSGLSRSNDMNPPNTTSVAMSGIIEFIPSMRPLSDESPLSVIHALNAASFAVEPKNVMTQSIMIVSCIPSVNAAVMLPAVFSSISVLISVNARIEIPQKIYPPQMKTLRFPTLSDSAPMSHAVNVAATALAATIIDMSEGDAWNILYMKTLKYMFSTTQAICPTSPNNTSENQNFLLSLCSI